MEPDALTSIIPSEFFWHMVDYLRQSVLSVLVPNKVGVPQGDCLQGFQGHKTYDCWVGRHKLSPLLVAYAPISCQISFLKSLQETNAQWSWAYCHVNNRQKGLITEQADDSSRWFRHSYWRPWSSKQYVPKASFQKTHWRRTCRVMSVLGAITLDVKSLIGLIWIQ